MVYSDLTNKSEVKGENMKYTIDALTAAKRQIDSTLHKLRETVKTFESKDNSEPVSYTHLLVLYGGIKPVTVKVLGKVDKVFDIPGAFPKSYRRRKLVPVLVALHGKQIA